MKFEDMLRLCNGNTMLFGGNEVSRWSAEEETTMPCPLCGEKDEYSKHGQRICTGCDAVKNKRDD